MNPISLTMTQFFNPSDGLMLDPDDFMLPDCGSWPLVDSVDTLDEYSPMSTEMTTAERRNDSQPRYGHEGLSARPESDINLESIMFDEMGRASPSLFLPDMHGCSDLFEISPGCMSQATATSGNTPTFNPMQDLIWDLLSTQGTDTWSVTKEPPTTCLPQGIQTPVQQHGPPERQSRRGRGRKRLPEEELM